MERQIKRKAIFYGIAAILLASTFSALLVLQLRNPGAPPIPVAHSSFLTSFTSTEALTNFLETNSQTQGPFSLYGPSDVKVFSSSSGPLMPGAINAFTAGVDTRAESYQHSGTNIQVEGVDEADLVKTDDNGYMYVLSNDTVYILTAYP